MPEIQRVWQESHRNYGARKVWKQLHREAIPAARCSVERLMGRAGLEGVRRGKRCITTKPDDSAHKPLDLVQRQFTAQRPNPAVGR
jgi:transposase InsO family protein